MFIDIDTNRYSSCSTLDPIRLVYRALELNLSEIVIVEHYTAWSLEEIQELKRETQSQLRILRGQEVICSIGHLLILGYYEQVNENIAVEEIIDKVHSAGGVAILAHPFRDQGTSRQDFSENDYGWRVWNALRVVGTAGTDGHCVEMVGKYLTRFENPIQDELDLVGEIKAGRSKPCRGRNVLSRYVPFWRNDTFGKNQAES